MARKQKHLGQASRATAVPMKDLRKPNKSSVELVPPSDKRFRSKVLASVGLDDDDSYDKCDIEEAGSHRLVHTNKSGNKRKGKKSGEDAAIENIELLEKEEDDDDDAEYESFDQCNNTTSSSNRCSTLKPMCNKLFWILLTAAAVVYIFYDDELLLEESETDDDDEYDIQKKQQPYSYNGYVDARIPTDDEAQFGGGLNDGGPAFPSEDDDEVANEMTNLVGHHHDPTGVVEVDILWEQLEGYAEISDPLDDNDLPVFWHIREYISCDYTSETNLLSRLLSYYIYILSQMWRNDIARHDVTLLWNGRGK